MLTASFAQKVRIEDGVQLFNDKDAAFGRRQHKHLTQYIIYDFLTNGEISSVYHILRHFFRLTHQRMPPMLCPFEREFLVLQAKLARSG